MCERDYCERRRALIASEAKQSRLQCGKERARAGDDAPSKTVARIRHRDDVAVAISPIALTTVADNRRQTIKKNGPLGGKRRGPQE
jgi:hypothetical protein